MDKEKYAFVLGALARMDRKLDIILESVRERNEDEDEEFEILDLDAEQGKV